MNTFELHKIIDDQREELGNIDLGALSPRMEEAQLDFESKMAQVVIGVRRSGKSTLCEKVLRQSGRLFAYINFDDERLSEIGTKDLNFVLDMLYRVYGDFRYLFLDEVQNVDGWPLFVNRLLRSGLHIFLTGSNAKLLSNELITHLTGRHNPITLFPFSFSEYCLVKRIDTISFSTKSRALKIRALNDYLQVGGFPELMYEKNRKAYVNGLLDSIIRRDIAKRFRIRHINSLRKLAFYLSDHYCQEFVASKVSAIFGISDHTANKYFSYLKEAYLLIGINKFSYKSAERIVNEKIYVVDNAFVTDREGIIATDNLGWRLENVVLLELLRRNKPLYREIYYYKDKTYQVDFVVTKAGKVLQLIQVSYDISSDKTRRREVNALIKAGIRLNCTNRLIVTLDHSEQIVTSSGIIDVVAASDWLLHTNGA